MAQLLRFAATAIVDQGAGYEAIATPDRVAESLFASTPLGAARAWYWRLSDQERSACSRIVVSAWTQPTLTLASLYNGPDMAFAPKDGWRLVSDKTPDAPVDTADRAAS